MARLALGVAGAAAGFLIGGPVGAQIGFAAGSIAGGFLEGPQKTRGPRLDDLKAPQATYGTPIAYLEGTNRVAGLIVWASDKREIATTEEVGGKGPSAESTTYTYEIDVLYMVSANVMAGIRRIWSNGKLIWSNADDADTETLSASANTDAWTSITVYTGAPGQLPDPIYEAAIGVGNVPAYRGRGTVMIEGLQLGGSGQLPVLTFEVVMDGDPGPAITRLSIDTANDDELTDASAYENGEGVISEPTGSSVTVGPQIIVTSAGGIDFAGVTWTPDNSSFDRDNTGVWTIEGYVTVVGTLPNATFNELLSYGWGFESIYSLGTATNVGRFAVVQAGQPGVAFSTGPAILGVRTHIALVQGGSQFRAYCDGQLQYSSDVGPASTASGIPFVRLGTRSGGSGPLEARFEAIRLRFTEEYTGISFTPPDPIPGPDGTTLSSNAVALDGVVSRACLRTGLLTAGDIDVTALASKSVRGMAVSQVTASRAVLENLMRAYHFECVEGEKLRFVLLGGASALTVPYEDLGCYIDGEPPEPLPLIRRNDIEQPSRVTVKFANGLNDYQDGAESSERIVTDSTAEEIIELPIVFTPQEAKRIADVRAMEIAASNLGLGQISLDNRYAKLEPTDVITLTGESGSTYRARIVKTSDAAGMRTFDCVIDDATAINSDAVTDEGYIGSTVVRRVGDTEVILIDGPLMRDVDDKPGYVAAFGASSAYRWPGAGFYDSLTETGTFEKLFDVTSRARYGTTTTALGDFSGGNEFDEANTVRVLVNGTLSSVTRDQIIDDRAANAFLIGAHGRWEVVQARLATLVSVGVYDLSSLLRGRAGTEHAIGSHEVGDTVVVLQSAGLRSIDQEVSDIGVTRYLKGVTFGKSIASATAQEFTPESVRLKPLAPVDLRVSNDGVRVLTWSRRTRIPVRDAFSECPLGEASESYDVEVTNGDGQTVMSTTVSEPSCDLASFAQTFQLAVDPAQRIRQVSTDYVGLSDGYPSARVTQLRRSDSNGQYLGAVPLGGLQATALINNGDDLYVSVVNGSSSAHVYRVARTDLFIGALFSPNATYTASLPADPQGLAFDGTNVWVSGSYSGTLKKLNASTLVEESSYSVNAGLGAMVYAGGDLWVCDRANDEIIQWDIGTQTEVKRIACARVPTDVFVANGLVFVAGSGLVQVMDASSGALISTYSGGFIDTFRQVLAHNGSEVVFADLVASELVFLDDTTGIESRRFPIENVMGVSGYGGGNMFASTRSPSASYRVTVETAAYGAADIVTGYTATVYQNSETVGRGYPASIVL